MVLTCLLSDLDLIAAWYSDLCVVYFCNHGFVYPLPIFSHQSDITKTVSKNHYSDAF